MMIQTDELVPMLRFTEFEGEWLNKSLKDVSVIYDGTHQTPKYVKEGTPFFSVTTVTNDNFLDVKYISREVYLATKEDKKLKKGDILMTRIGDIGTAKFINRNSKAAYYVSLSLIRPIEIQGLFLNQLIGSDYFQKELWSKTIHVAFPKKINLGEIGECKLNHPKKEEQQKIASFLTAVDTKIQQLESLKSAREEYKKGVMQKIFSQEIRFKDEHGEEFGEWEEKRLGELCSITTGKLDANAMVDGGRYRFYTCAKNYYYIDQYAFDTDALLVSGNGANVGYIHHYAGKFNAYQRTYVLDGFGSNILYVRIYLDMHLRKRILGEKKEGSMPYIVLSTLRDMKIKLPSVDEQCRIVSIIGDIDTKLGSVTDEIKYAKLRKKGLLQQMFV